MEDKIKRNRRLLEAIRPIVERLETVAGAAAGEISAQWKAADIAQTELEAAQDPSFNSVVAVGCHINRLCIDMLDTEDRLCNPTDLLARIERLESRSRVDNRIIARMSDCIMDLMARPGPTADIDRLSDYVTNAVAAESRRLSEQVGSSQLVLANQAEETKELICNMAEQMQMQIYSDVIAEINAEVAPRIASMAEWISFSTADGGEIVTQYRRESEARLNGDLLLLTDGSKDGRMLSAHVRTFRAYDTPDDFTPEERERNEALLAITGPPGVTTSDDSGDDPGEIPGDVPCDLLSMMATHVYGGEYTDHETTYTRSMRAERERKLNPDGDYKI